MQSKGFLKGVRFEVFVRIELSRAQARLVEYYNLRNEVLLQRPLINIWGQPTEHRVDIKVSQLLDGEVFRCKDLSEVLIFSESVKEACQTFKYYLIVARHFGGEEIFEI